MNARWLTPDERIASEWAGDENNDGHGTPIIAELNKFDKNIPHLNLRSMQQRLHGSKL